MEWGYVYIVLFTYLQKQAELQGGKGLHYKVLIEAIREMILIEEAQITEALDLSLRWHHG